MRQLPFWFWRWLLLWLALCAGPLLARADVPLLQAYATDLSGSLGPAELARLNARLAAFDQRHGAQLLLLMVEDTGGEAIETYALAVVEANRPGRKGLDDGVLLLVAKRQREARIEVGYGLEGAIPDAAAARILRQDLGPRFRQGDYAGGIEQAVDHLAGLIGGEDLPPRTPRGGKGVRPWPLLLVLALLLRVLPGRLPKWLRGGLAALIGAGLMYRPGSLPLALAGAVVGGLVVWLLPAGRGPGGSGGLGGGGLGGGFRGGGGGFGGGGASGRW